MVKSERYDFVDFLRGIAMTVMIEVHIFNALLVNGLKTGTWFTVLNFVNGLVAPAFIFISGFAFTFSFAGISETGRINFIRKKTPRILLIILAGYTVHLPAFTLQGFRYVAGERGLKEFYNVDVLQCIGTGLILLMLIAVVSKTAFSYRIIVSLTGAAIVIFSPLVWTVDFTSVLPGFFASYFNELNGSYFPIFPWLGFMFAGSLTASIYSEAKEREKEFLKKTGLLGIVLALSGLAVLYFLEQSPGFSIRPNQFFFIERLGVIFILLYVCRILCDRKGPLKNILLKVSRESLGVYWLHLLLIYKPFFAGKSLNDLFFGRLEISACLLITFIMIMTMFLFAYCWSALKRSFPLAFKRGFMGTVAVLMMVFLIK